MKGIAFNPKWLLLLGIAGVSFVALDSVLPGAGVALAAGVALWWTIDTGAIDYVTKGISRIQKAAAL